MRLLEIGQHIMVMAYPHLQKNIINTLTITPEHSVEFKRVFADGYIHSYSKASTSIEFNKEVFIISFYENKKLDYKLVLSGWRNGSDKLIFGTLFLYKDDALFNGIPVSFKPAVANKALNTDSAKNVFTR